MNVHERPEVQRAMRKAVAASTRGPGLKLVTDTPRVPHIRTSERRSFKRCQQQWQWAWRQGLVPRYEKPGALWFGTGMHLALQHFYAPGGLKRNRDLIDVWREYAGDTQAVVYGDNYTEDKDDFYDAIDLGCMMLDGYLDYYGDDQRWYVLATEHSFELPIPHPIYPLNTLALYNGTFDLVARDEEADGSVWLWDHKNLKSIQTTHLTLDDQMGSYWAVAADVLADVGLISKGEKLDGILYNILRKAKPDSRPVNDEGLRTNKPIKAHYAEVLQTHGLSSIGTLAQLTERADNAGLRVLGDVSKSQPLPLFHRELVWRTRPERKMQIQRIQQEALQMQDLRDRVRLPTKNPTKDCPHDCQFFQMCELHESGDDWKEFRDASFVRRDPYAAHR